MEAFENMNKKTKIILSIVGICAVVVPALLLIFVSRSTDKVPEVDNGKRQIDQKNIENIKDKSSAPTNIFVPVSSPEIPLSVPGGGKSGEATPASK